MVQASNRNGRLAIQTRYILMPVSMLVKCEKCGYENFPQHRYCGMCAAELRLPSATGGPPAPASPPSPRVSSATAPPYVAPKYKEAVPRPREKKEVVRQQVSGPSFLGLGSEPAEDKGFSYLLEDETPTHRGRNLIVILLLAGAAAAGWHWRRDLRGVAERFLNSPPPAAKAGGSDNQDPAASAPAAADSASGAAPASSANTGTAAEKTSAGADAQAPAAQTPPPAAAPVGAAASGTADSTQPGPADQSPSPSTAGDAAATAAAAKPDDSEETPTAPPAHARKSDMTRAQRAAASASQTDDLEAQGEKYLYGNGVPENCGRARTNLLAAAQHSNAQAESVLGTMYATGHCATRDLPTAYRWFGRSLRQDPKNSRIEQDLRVLWNQMTPEERQLALRDVR